MDIKIHNCIYKINKSVEYERKIKENRKVVCAMLQEHATRLKCIKIFTRWQNSNFCFLQKFRTVFTNETLHKRTHKRMHTPMPAFFKTWNFHFIVYHLTEQQARLTIKSVAHNFRNFCEMNKMNIHRNKMEKKRRRNGKKGVKWKRNKNFTVCVQPYQAINCFRNKNSYQWSPTVGFWCEYLIGENFLLKATQKKSNALGWEVKKEQKRTKVKKSEQSLQQLSIRFEFRKKKKNKYNFCFGKLSQKLIAELFQLFNCMAI